MKWIFFLLPFILIIDTVEPLTNSSVNFKKILVRAKVLLKENEATLVLVHSVTGNIEGIINEKLATKTVKSPGSTFKIVTAMTGLKKNPQLLNFKVYCTDKFYIYGQGLTNQRIFFNKSRAIIGDYYQCTQRQGHHSTDMRKALHKSCNYYFMTLGDKIGYQNYYNTVLKLGFGQKLFPTWKDGHSGSVQFAHRRTKKLLAYIGDGGTITVTPIQMALLANYIATEGAVKTVRYKKNEVLMQSIRIDAEGEFKKEVAMAKKMLPRKVSTGTDFFNGYQFKMMTGKTGTSSAGKFYNTFAWFIGFAGKGDNMISFSLYMNNANGVTALKKMSKILLYK